MRRDLYQPEHEDFRDAFRTFLRRESVPNTERWEAAGVVDREFWRAAGTQGFLGFEAPVEFGGLGVSDYRYNAVMAEEMVGTGTAGDGFTLHNDIVSPYLCDLTTPEQKRRWLPGFTSGEMITAIAMTEPEAGSDLAGIRTTAHLDGDQFVLNGTKTFITNGARADLALVLARTGENGGKGTSLLAVEDGTPGFGHGKPMAKIGRKAQDTAELTFSDCQIPRQNLIGAAGRGFAQVMRGLPRERLSIATLAVAAAERALNLAVDYCGQRRSFGKPLGRHQAIRFALAEMRTEVSIARVYVDRCVVALNDGELSEAEAAGVKYWTTDLQCQVVDRCLQLFGGYGYMEEYPIARMWRDARIQRIYGGTNEIMKEVVGRSMGL